MTQYALPNGNSGVTNWIEGVGDADADWFDELDEGFGAGRGSGSGPDDATTAWTTPLHPANEAIEVTLAAVADPLTAAGHIMLGRFAKNLAIGEQIDVTLQLYQTTTLIASVAATGLPSTYSTLTYTLSAAEANAITDYSALRLRAIGNAPGAGTTRRAICSALEFECPSQNLTRGQHIHRSIQHFPQRSRRGL